MANFIGLVYATLKNEGIDIKNMSTDEAIKKYNELQKSDKDNKQSPQQQMKQGFQQEVEEFLNDSELKVKDIKWKDDFLVIDTDDNDKAFKEIRNNYLYNDVVKQQGKVFVKLEEQEGTPAEKQRMQEPKSKHIDHDKFDEIQDWFVSRPDRTKIEIKGFKDAREQINELANSGLTYDEIDEKLFHIETQIDYEYDKLADKKDKSSQDIQRMKELREYGTGFKTAFGQKYRVWKK